MSDSSSTRPLLRAAVAGFGAISAVGAGIPALREAMRTNSSGLRHVARFDLPRFQSSIVGAAAPQGKDDADPAFEFATIAIKEALEKRTAPRQLVHPERVGLVLSTTKANIEALERLADGRPCPDRARRHLRGDLLAADLAAESDARGPVQCISVACASGLVALQQGAKLIERGQADAVMVVGVDHLSAFVVAGFSALKALDPSGCHPFDQARCGLTPGEAGAVVYLLRSDLAPPGYVKILGWGTSNDANHLTGPSRDGSGLARAIHAALQHAALSEKDVDYINAHGTGTSYNDAMESRALEKVFGNGIPPVSGSKGMFGHTLGAAGLLEAIVCCLALEAKIIPGTPRLTVADPTAPASLVREPRAGKLNRVLKLNTGFGGINAALVLGYE